VYEILERGQTDTGQTSLYVHDFYRPRLLQQHAYDALHSGSGNAQAAIEKEIPTGKQARHPSGDKADDNHDQLSKMYSPNGRHHIRGPLVSFKIACVNRLAYNVGIGFYRFKPITEDKKIRTKHYSAINIGSKA